MDNTCKLCDNLAVFSDSNGNYCADHFKVPCEVWSRIVGYMRPVHLWNTAKQQEFNDRKMFQVSEAQIEHVHKSKILGAGFIVEMPQTGE